MFGRIYKIAWLTAFLLLAMPFFTACDEEVALSCRDECYAGERKCVDNTNGYIICDNYNDDICLEWPKEATSCPEGSACSEGYCLGTGDDACKRGKKRCDTEVNGYEVCEYVDTVLKWGSVTPCKAGTYCRGGECADCQDKCTAGSKRCSPTSNSVEMCLVNKENGCLEWQESQPCVGNTVCSGSSCTLPEKCYDDCFSDQAICEGNGYRVCGQYDNDPCSEFGPIIYCPYGEYCSNGRCDPECVNECSVEGQRECYNNGFRICANVDSDPCLDWSYNPCPLDESCSLGECAPLDLCTDECQTKTCTADGRHYQECGQYDIDKCADLGPAQACEPNFECIEGECVCSCDYVPNVCEPAAHQSAEKCACDADCKTQQMCMADSYCDGWCVPGVDPDCADECECDYTLFCDAGCNFAGASGCPSPSAANINCYCDSECSPNKQACRRDGFVDEWCPTSGPWADPDVGKELCSNYTISGGYYSGDSSELKTSGSIELPDEAEGEGWILLGPTVLTSGALEASFNINNVLYDCAASLELAVYGYDSCYGVGAEGAQIYFYNWQTAAYDLQSGSVTNEKSWTYYKTTQLSRYLKCGGLYCNFHIKIATGNWQCSHIKTIKYSVTMQAK